MIIDFDFVLFVIEAFSIYARIVPLKGKRYIKITYAFQKFSDEPSLVNHKPDNILGNK